MAMPFVAVVLIFSYVPLAGWIYALFNFKPGIPLSQSPFVGLKYFRQAFNFSAGSSLLQVFRNTVVMSGLNIACSVLPVAFAILLSELRGSRFKKVIQVTTTLPNFISWVLVYAIAFAAFSTDDGFVNLIMMKMALISAPTSILASGNAAWWFQTALGVWKGLGFGAIIYLATIGGLDPELYQAADVDGASRFAKIIYITIPGIASTYIVLLLLAISNFLSNGFDQYYAFMNAMVQVKLQVLDYYIYRTGLMLNQYSFSTALGIIKTVVSVILLFTVNFIVKRVRGTSII